MDERTVVGHVAESARASHALAAGRHPLLTGTHGSGRSRLLSEVLHEHAPRVTRLEARRNGLLLSSGAGGPASLLEDGEALGDALADVARRRRILAIDDLDLLPVEVLSPLVDELRYRSTAFAATTAPPSLISARDPVRWSVLRPLFDAETSVAIDVRPLTLTETTALGALLRRERYGVGAADDAWSMALHGLSGGNPLLISELVDAASLAGRLGAFTPIDPRMALLPGRVVESVVASLQLLDDAQRRIVCVLGELGPLPVAHLHAIGATEDLARLSDCGLVRASSDAAVVRVSPLVARVARDRVRSPALAVTRRGVARILLTLLGRGTRLTLGEEILCVRAWSAAPVGELPEPPGGVIARAALALSRSHAPGEAVVLVDAIPPENRDMGTAVALVLAQAALGDRPAARAARRAMPSPRDRADADLALMASLRTAMIDGDDPHRHGDDMVEATAWLPDDAAWSYRLRCMQSLLTAVLAGKAPSETVPPAPDDLGADDRAYAEACAAVLAAARGRGADALELLRSRRSRHSLEVEPHTGIFLLHCVVYLLLGRGLDLVQNTTRRRMLAACEADRQDELACLGLIDAVVQLLNGRPAEVFASLQAGAVTPPPVVRVWSEAVRAAAHLLVGNPLRAAEIVERIDGVSRLWSTESFAAVRETLRALFELRSGRPEAAAARSLRTLPEAEKTFVILTVALLRIARAAQTPLRQVRDRAVALSRTHDLPALRDFLVHLGAEGEIVVTHALDRLTGRERQVVTLATSGMPNAVIASRLNLSVRTVESHLYNARTRLGMRRAERFAPADALVRRGSFGIDED